ncbi:MAG TPA: zinc-dependent metalloprotease [Acidimicrobiales bacterium]|nr:zinc-dependent metalloprotease [Acidimicrobiales bacterium]
MSAPGPFGGDNPFEAMPIFGDLAKLFTNQGPVNWEVARQIGGFMAAEGQSEDNVDPLERIRLEELARVAELQIADFTGLATSTTGRSVSVRATNRSEWANVTLEAYRPLFGRLASSLGSSMQLPAEDADDPLATGLGGPIPEEMLGNLIGVMAPMILGMQLGLMVGHLAKRSLGQYDLPVPRPLGDELLVVATNLDVFGKDWSLPADDLRLWVCLDSVAHHAVLGLPHVRQRLEELLFSYAGGFAPDPNALTERMSDIDPTDQGSWEHVFGDPDAFFGTLESDEQRRIKPELLALTSTIEGYIDYTMDEVGGRLIASYGSLAEALRRRRVEANKGDRFVERLFGLELSQRHFDRGEAFVRGVVERHGAPGLARLWSSAVELPTPNEVDAPGLWWERIHLPR